MWVETDPRRRPVMRGKEGRAGRLSTRSQAEAWSSVSLPALGRSLLCLYSGLRYSLSKVRHNTFCCLGHFVMATMWQLTQWAARGHWKLSRDRRHKEPCMALPCDRSLSQYGIWVGRECPNRNHPKSEPANRAGWSTDASLSLRILEHRFHCVLLAQQGSVPSQT